MTEGDIHFENGSRIYMNTGSAEKFVGEGMMYISKSKIASAKCQEFECERSYVMPLLNALAPHNDFSVKKVNEALDVLIPKEITVKELELIQLTLQKNLESVQRDGVNVYEVDGCIFVNRDEEIIIEQEIAEYINDLIVESAQEEAEGKIKEVGGDDEKYYGKPIVSPANTNFNGKFETVSVSFDVKKDEIEDAKDAIRNHVSEKS